MKKRGSASEEFTRLNNNPGAVVNVNDHALNQYREMRKRHHEVIGRVNEINTVKEEVKGLKEELSDIKSMLAQLLEKTK